MKALPRLVAGLPERVGERKVRAAKGTPLLKVEAAGDSWEGKKRTTAPEPGEGVRVRRCV
jgi:hypothetical protein